MLKKCLSNRIILITAVSIFLVMITTVIYLLSTDEYTDAKFRTMQDRISSSEKVDLTGLRELQASGGPMFYFPDLQQRLSYIPKTIIIVDGIRQYHGYINDVPTSFFGYDAKDVDCRHFIRRLIFTGTLEERHDLVTPESQKAQEYGFAYKNIRIESKFISPNHAVDAFVAFIDHLPTNVWLHFHCRHGKGRTSMMLAMYDIMQNAPTVALKDIIKRQHLLGSMDLFDTTVWKRKRGTYSSRTLKRRKKFIENFYVFICQRKAGGIQSWSDWRKMQQKSGMTSALNKTSRETM